MSSFSCQFIDSEKSYCIRLKKDCIPGRPGCVLKGRFVFAIPAEKRMTPELDKNQNNKKRKEIK
ncbi:MAG: hypothetical protein QHH13_08555 [Melioribacter sp.]|uniref:hypothetical protein n=1 Tax=Rosettibacter primus TaxID=3111523 RepID=UPI00247D4C37|nr:hypothetical protein [Melioribacter sp.]